MNIPLLDLQAQHNTIRDEVRTAVDRVFESQRFVLGPEGTALEKEIAACCGVPSAVAVASGTDAILLSLKALEIGPGDSVITVPYTFFATAGAIANAGAVPLFVDIEDESMNLDATVLSEFLSNECSFNVTTREVTHRRSRTRVRAIMPVHLFGQCADMDAVVESARRYNLFVVEDACQAIGAEYKARPAGSMGEIGCFSFFPSKNLGGAGDGGMVVSQNPDFARRVRLLRGHGAEPKYFHKIVGFNSRLDEVQAAVLRVKLRYLEQWNLGRAANAAAYDHEFNQAGLSDCVRTPSVAPGRRHIFHQYTIRGRHRDLLQSYLAKCGIGSEVYYPLSLHEQECFRHLRYQVSDCPVSHATAQTALSLPIYPELSGQQIRTVVRAVREFYRAEGWNATRPE